MKLFGLEFGGGARRAPEAREVSIERPGVPVSSDDILTLFGIDTRNAPAVTIDNAMQVPAFSCGVSFLSRTLAGLPLHAYRDGGDQGAIRLTGAVQRTLNEAPNPEWTSFGLRRYFWQQVFSAPGRGLMWIERLGSTSFTLWPIDATTTTVKREGGRKFYVYGGKTFPAADVIDVPFMLKADQLATRSPLQLGEKVLSLALAMGAYQTGFFAGGGVPPLALSGPMPAGADALKRAQADVKRAIDGAKARGEQIMPIPAGYDLKPVGFDPDKGQMTEAQRFVVEQLARILGLPPAFLQDLTHGTFTNTEQQDLHLSKHVISPWARALEEELNLKLFGAANSRRYVEHNLDGLMRGDFKTRIEALARGIQTSQLTPDEARALENRGPKPGGDKLYIQGATVPLGEQPKPGATPPPADENGAGDDA